MQVAQTYTSERLVVLVMIEQQQAEVGGLPEQDWSLRVTEVYRKEGSEWQLAHRHADPLVRRITLEQAAALARLTISIGKTCVRAKWVDVVDACTCPLWVKSRHLRCNNSCPLYPRKQTCAAQLGMSALCQ